MLEMTIIRVEDVPRRANNRRLATPGPKLDRGATDKDGRQSQQGGRRSGFRTQSKRFSVGVQVPGWRSGD